MRYLYFTIPVFYLLLLSAVVSFAQPSGPTGIWNKVFEDNFDGTALDQQKWGYNYPWGHTHNHRAYMTDSMVTVQNGLLSIKAIDKRHPLAPAGTNQWASSFGYLSFDYTSGAIHSKGKFEATYGYFEGRFKMPSTLGTWPAFWTLNDDGSWPPEIDILEVPKERTVHHYYYHYGPDSQHESSFGSTHTGPDKSQDFHVYGVEWGPDYMKFYFDGKLVNSYTGRTEASQGKNMYMIINLAIGGWAGDPPAGAVFPTYYQCDWVRVWKMDPSANFNFETGTLSPWNPWNNATVTQDCKNSGSYGVKLSGSPASIERTVVLDPSTTYVFGGYGKVNTSGESAMFGVKNYGGNQLVKTISGTGFKRDSVVFTTGSTNTSAIVFWYKETGSGTACGDDFFLYKLNDKNTAPLVTITAPVNNATYTAPASVLINATASDADGIISKVDFYNGSALLGSDAGAPYSYSWEGIAAGSYSITAKATDDKGGIAVSAPVNIIVNPDKPSVIRVITPSDQAVIEGNTVSIQVTATDPDGTITKVEYLDGTILVGSSTTMPYSFTWDSVAPGEHHILIRVTDSNGGITLSDPVVIQVQGTATGIAFAFMEGMSASVFPNPFRESFTVNAKQEIRYMWLVNVSGQCIELSQNITTGQPVEAGKDLPKGVYDLILQYMSGNTENIRIVKLR